MFTTCKITARLSTSRQVEISYNLLGNVLHAQVNGKHMDLSRNFLLLLKINIIYSPRNKPGTLTPGKQLKDGDKGSIISIS